MPNMPNEKLHREIIPLIVLIIPSAPSARHHRTGTSLKSYISSRARYGCYTDLAGSIPDDERIYCYRGLMEYPELHMLIMLRVTKTRMSAATAKDQVKSHGSSWVRISQCFIHQSTSHDFIPVCSLNQAHRDIVKIKIVGHTTYEYVGTDVVHEFTSVREL